MLNLEMVDNKVKTKAIVTDTTVGRMMFAMIKDRMVLRITKTISKDTIMIFRKKRFRISRRNLLFQKF